jgi:hypothetical protein
MIVVRACVVKGPWRQRYEHPDRDESTGLNDKLFAYNETSRHISRTSRPRTYAQLVEAVRELPRIDHPPGQPAQPERTELARADAVCRSISVRR